MEKGSFRALRYLSWVKLRLSHVFWVRHFYMCYCMRNEIFLNIYFYAVADAMIAYHECFVITLKHA